jgi:hypothetical protein
MVEILGMERFLKYSVIIYLIWITTSTKGISSNDGNRPYTVIRTETISTEGIVIVNFAIVPKV